MATSSQSYPKSGARLLSMDGGGVKGVSGLVFLDELMQRVKAIEIKRGSTNQAERKPSDYFDLAAGTSTGGLMAVMLFRLRMSVSECRAEYHKLADDIFAPRILGIPIKSPKFIQTLAKGLLWAISPITGYVYKPQPLLKAVDACVREHPLDENDKAKLGEARLENPAAGKMIVCSTLVTEGESVLFRSYPQPSDSKPITKPAKEAFEHGDLDRVTIRTAAQATSAAPFFFPAAHWNPSGKRGADLVFWDGGLLNNNPILQLWSSRYDLVSDTAAEPKISCVVSLGCSIPSKKLEVPRLFITRLITAISYITNTTSKDHDFEALVQRMNNRDDENHDLVYFRFDAVTNKEHFSMDDASIMSRLEQVTRDYIAGSPEVQKQLDDAAERLTPKSE